MYKTFIKTLAEYEKENYDSEGRIILFCSLEFLYETLGKEYNEFTLFSPALNSLSSLTFHGYKVVLDTKDLKNNEWAFGLYYGPYEPFRNIKHYSF